MAETMTNGNAAAAARRLYNESGGTITGKELAAELGMSERWGRLQIAAARQNGTASVATAPADQVPVPQRSAVDTAKPPAHRRGKVPAPLVTGTIVAVAVVAAVAAVVSYSHVRDLAVAAGAGWRADILPLSLDGLVAAATCTLVLDRRRGRAGHPLAWAGIVVGLVGSVAANVLAVIPGLVDLRVVAGVLAGFPPVALAVSAHLLVRTLADR
jgi:hypothetical protein